MGNILRARSPAAAAARIALSTAVAMMVRPSGDAGVISIAGEQPAARVNLAAVR